MDRSEDESLAIDIIIVVISLEDNNISHALLEEIYAEANVRTRRKLVLIVEKFVIKMNLKMSFKII